LSDLKATFTWLQGSDSPRGSSAKLGTIQRGLAWPLRRGRHARSERCKRFSPRAPPGAHGRGVGANSCIILKLTRFEHLVYEIYCPGPRQVRMGVEWAMEVASEFFHVRFLKAGAAGRATACQATCASAPKSPVGKKSLSDGGGPGFESQTGWVRGNSIRSPWRDRHPAVKGLRPPKHQAEKFHPDQ